ncbi:hypothetical protein LINGRAHAP2_LOCUS563 [Linum grandiflorum]
MNTLLLRSSSDRIHRNDAGKQRYYAAIRPWDFINPISINHLPFTKMHLDISDLLQALGWESTLINLLTEFIPLATKLFNSNLRSSQTFPNTFTTIVMDDHIRFSAQVFSCLLDITIVGQVINDEADIWRQGFDGLTALLEICPAFPLGFLPSKFQVNLLPSPLRLLHYFITRVILPRSFSLGELLPLDIFIIWHVVHLQPISLPHLLILHISKAVKDGFPGDLPCAPLITRFLFNMGIDLYGLEMVGLQTITTPGDVLTTIDLSPSNSPDISSGGEDDSADADLPATDINDTGTASHAHAVAPANKRMLSEVNPQTTTWNMRKLKKLNLMIMKIPGHLSHQEFRIETLLQLFLL